MRTAITGAGILCAVIIVVAIALINAASIDKIMRTAITDAGILCADYFVIAVPVRKALHALPTATTVLGAVLFTVLVATALDALSLDTLVLVRAAHAANAAAAVLPAPLVLATRCTRPHALARGRVALLFIGTASAAIAAAVVTALVCFQANAFTSVAAFNRQIVDEHAGAVVIMGIHRGEPESDPNALA